MVYVYLFFSYGICCRGSVSDSESESKTGSSSQDDAAVGASDGKYKPSGEIVIIICEVFFFSASTHSCCFNVPISPEGNKSPLVERENSKINHKKGEAADMSDKEEGEFPRENGDHQSNGTGVGIGSDRAADRHPDVLDDLPSKSRSIFL